jgi:hypothetical protein
LLLSLLVCLSAGAVMPEPGTPGAPEDPRYCGEPARYDSGRIKRSSATLAQFARVFPCPATLAEGTTSCEGWQIDHIIPLASGGCDAPVNLQWLPLEIKTCTAPACKDRWERRYHTLPRRTIP